MNKLTTLLNNRPGSVQDADAPRVNVRGWCSSNRLLRAIFPRATVPGIIVLGTKELRNHAFEIHERKVNATGPAADANASTAVESPASQDAGAAKSSVYELVIRTIAERRAGSSATLCEFKSKDEAQEALQAIEQAMNSSSKKRWIVASIAAFIFVVFFMPVTSGNSGQSQQRIVQNGGLGDKTAVLAMPSRSGPPNTSIPAPFGATQAPVGMPQGAFPAPVAPQAQPGFDASSMPLPTPGIAPAANPYAGNAQPQAQVPAYSPEQGGQVNDEDPFGLKR